jgi:hypothetical protein
MTETLTNTALLIGPAALVGLGLALIHRALHESKRWLSWGSLAGIALLLLVCVYLAWLSSKFDIFALVFAVFAVITAAVTGIWFLWSLSGRRRVAGLLVLTLVPALLIASVFAGANYSPPSVAKRDGTRIAEALQAYRDDRGVYPTSLTLLTPEYLATVPKDPPFVWGWLYTVKDDTFYLGYVTYVDREGYSVSYISSDSMEWEYEVLSTGPFTLGPTPAP